MANRNFPHSDTVRSSWTPEKSDRGFPLFTLLGVVGLLVAVGYGYWSWAQRAGQRAPASETQLRRDAWNRAHEDVPRFLKAPASASFAGEGETRLLRDPEGRRIIIVVSSHVDSQNSFGAMIRSPWSARYVTNPTGTDWQLEFLSIGEQTMVGSPLR
ncbi:MAG: hypothetical protein AB7G12_12835 [Thermoanaerobaculia bacterium]